MIGFSGTLPAKEVIAGKVTFRQPRFAGVGTTISFEISGRQDGAYAWGVVAGQSGCDCIKDNSCQPLSKDVIISDITKTKLQVTTVPVTTVFTDVQGVSLIGKDAILGQMLVIMDNDRIPIVFAPIKEVSARTVESVFGADSVYGRVTMHQASPFDNVVIDMDLTAPAALHDWALLKTPAVKSISDLTGARAHDCGSTSASNLLNANIEVDCDVNPKQCIGNLGAVLGKLDDSDSDNTFTKETLLDFSSDATFATKKKRTYITDKLTLFGKDTIAERSLNLVVGDKASSCTDQYLGADWQSLCTLGSDMARCRCKGMCELYKNPFLEKLSCRQRQTCAPMHLNGRAATFVAQFGAEVVSECASALCGSVRIKQIPRGLSRDTLLSMHLASKKSAIYKVDIYIVGNEDGSGRNPKCEEAAKLANAIIVKQAVAGAPRTTTSMTIVDLPDLMDGRSYGIGFQVMFKNGLRV